MQHIIFLFIAAGLTNILVYGSIFDKIRPNIKPFTCSMCMGFWSGIFIGLLDILNFITLFNIVTTIGDLFLIGCGSSLISYILCQTFGDDGVQINVGK